MRGLSLLTRLSLAIGLFTAASTSQAAVRAEKRVALVIGNSAYARVAALPNPVRDAAAIAAKLKKLKFSVDLRTDLSLQGMTDAFKAFAEVSKGADVSMIFYAGHGISLNNQNFLIPTDVPAEIVVSTEAEGVKALSKHLLTLEGADAALKEAKVGLIFLDACRNTPSKEELGLKVVSQDVTSGTKRSVNFTRGNTSGVSVTASSGSGGIYRAYATAANQPADDGEGENSPFTTALLKYIDKPNLDIHGVMLAVRQEVYRVTERRQQPWDESGLFVKFFFVPPGELDRPEALRPRPSSPGTAIQKPSAKPRTVYKAPGGRSRSRAGGGGGGGLPPGIGGGAGMGL